MDNAHCKASVHTGFLSWKTWDKKWWRNDENYTKLYTYYTNNHGYNMRTLNETDKQVTLYMYL